MRFFSHSDENSQLLDQVPNEGIKHSNFILKCEILILLTIWV